MVHILRYGRPLCGFSDDIPRDWPDGHMFVSFGGSEDDVTCGGCKATSANLRERAERKSAP
jgi:hypothetical protein